jgi:hypothetical protein
MRLTRDEILLLTGLLLALVAGSAFKYYREKHQADVAGLATPAPKSIAGKK